MSQQEREIELQQSQRTPLMLSEVNPEDVEEGAVEANYVNGILDDSQIINFIEKYTNANQGYPEFYYQSLADMFANPTLENPITGRFQGVPNVAASQANQQGQEKARVDENDAKLHQVPAVPKLDGDTPAKPTALNIPPSASTKARKSEDFFHRSEEWEVVSMEYRNFAFVKRMVFLLFQGLLGGFCTVTIFLSSISTESTFLSDYQPIANDVRRYMYILSTISLVGAMDYLLTTLSSLNTRNPLTDHLNSTLTRKLDDYQKTSLLYGTIISLLYMAAFLCSVLMAPFDAQVFVRNGIVTTTTNDDGWVSAAMSDSAFTTRYNGWSSMNTIRAATSLLAWILCCVLLWRDVSRYAKLWAYLRRVRHSAVSWMARAKVLEGVEGLDLLTVQELKDVISAQEFGLSRSNMALSFKQA